MCLCFCVIVIGLEFALFQMHFSLLSIFSFFFFVISFTSSQFHLEGNNRNNASHADMIHSHQKRLKLDSMKFVDPNHDLKIRYNKWRKNRTKESITTKNVVERVKHYCKTKEANGCSWSQAYELMQVDVGNGGRYDVYESDVQEDTLEKKWILPTRTISEATPKKHDHSCKRLKYLPSSSEFLNSYVSKSIPVVIEGGVNQWRAIHSNKWTLQYLQSKLKKGTRVKVFTSLNDEFESVHTVKEYRDMIESVHANMTLNENVDLADDELIMIRPAETEFTFDDYVYLSTKYENPFNVSFYLQKHNLFKWGMGKYGDGSGLLDDLYPPLYDYDEKDYGINHSSGLNDVPSDRVTGTNKKKKKKQRDKSEQKNRKKKSAGRDIAGKTGKGGKGGGREILKKEKKTKKKKSTEDKSTTCSSSICINVSEGGMGRFLKLFYFLLWTGQGFIRGNIHYDAYENLHALIRGSKTFVIFHPNHKGMYEKDAQFRSAHLLFEWNKVKGTRVYSLPVSVTEKSYQPFSPVNISHPDPDLHPLFTNEGRLTCQVNEGDLFYLPSFWWHEVLSRGDGNSEDNAFMGINMFFEPWFVKGNDRHHFSRNPLYSLLHRPGDIKVEEKELNKDYFR